MNLKKCISILAKSFSKVSKLNNLIYIQIKDDNLNINIILIN